MHEGLVDALTVWSAGLRNVTGLAGPEGWGDEHSAALQRHSVGRVILGFDNDVDGNAGAGDLAERLRGEGIEVFRLRLPEGADINDVAVAASDPADRLAELVSRAECDVADGEVMSKEELLAALKEEVDLENRPHPGEDRP